MTTAAAPSTTPEAFPAVTKDSGPNAVGSFASDSAVVFLTTWSSSLCVTTVSPRRPLMVTGMISCSNTSFSIEAVVKA